MIKYRSSKLRHGSKQQQHSSKAKLDLRGKPKNSIQYGKE